MTSSRTPEPRRTPWVSKRPLLKAASIVATMAKTVAVDGPRRTASRSTRSRKPCTPPGGICRDSLPDRFRDENSPQSRQRRPRLHCMPSKAWEKTEVGSLSTRGRSWHSETPDRPYISLLLRESPISHARRCLIPKKVGVARAVRRKPDRHVGRRIQGPAVGKTLHQVRIA